MTKILFLSGDQALIGGIEKYNHDLKESISLCDADIRLVQRKQGGLAQKILFLLKIAGKLLSNKFDYVVCGHLYFSSVPLLINLLFGTKYSISIYGIEAMRITNLLHRSALKKANKVIVISEYTKSLISNQFNLPDHAYFYLPSSINENIFNIQEDKALLKKKYGLDGKLVILTLSRLSSDEEKGQHRVLKAFDKITNKDSNIKYVMAGPGEDERVERVLRGNVNLKNNAIQMGSVTPDQRVELYNLCDLFILPSKNEGFGIVFIEALSCGIPIIASDGFGCREALLDGKLGHLVDPDDIDAMASKITSILQSVKNITLERRLNIRNQSIEMYGSNKWNERVNSFVQEMRSL